MSTPGDGPAVAATVDAFRVASLDGSILALGEATVPVTDEGLLRGDGVFEVIRLYGGRPFALGAHLERMVGSAAHLRLALDVEAVAADASALLAAAQPGDGLLRLVVTRGGRRIALLEPLPDLGSSMSLSSIEYCPPRVLDGVKSLSYAANMLASRLARERGYDEALLVTPCARVLEAPTASLFWVRDGSVLTPPLDDHVLDSITRRRVIETAGAREQVTTLESLDGADEVFLASTVREVLPVRRVDERDFPRDGAVTAAVAAAVTAGIRQELSREA